VFNLVKNKSTKILSSFHLFISNFQISFGEGIGRIKMKKNRNLRLMLLLSTVLFFSVSTEAKITRYLTGNPGDVNPVLYGPAHNFGGGGADVDAALQWIIDQVRGCTNCLTKIDVVILRTSGADGYNSYIYAMKGVDSVESIVMTAARDVTDASVNNAIRNAEVVFFAGGDQCNYVTFFKGTSIETNVEYVYQKGGGVGGTSAGTAIQSPFIYDGCRGSATSADALSNPYHRSVSFTYNMFNWINMQVTLTDSHFFQRDRMGRTMAFLARQIKDGVSPTALGVAIDEATSVVVDKFGIAGVIGAGNAYFILADHLPERCVSGSSLTYSNYKIWKIGNGGFYNLQNRPTTGYYIISVTNGVLSGNPY
jgi:cyanophycinase